MKQIGENYQCYSRKVYGFLLMKGFRYEYSFIHNKTKKKCWVFKVTEELTHALSEWTTLKEQSKNKEQ